MSDDDGDEGTTFTHDRGNAGNCGGAAADLYGHEFCQRRHDRGNADNCGSADRRETATQSFTITVEEAADTDNHRWLHGQSGFAVQRGSAGGDGRGYAAGLYRHKYANGPSFQRARARSRARPRVGSPSGTARCHGWRYAADILQQICHGLSFTEGTRTTATVESPTVTFTIAVSADLMPTLEAISDSSAKLTKVFTRQQ